MEFTEQWLEICIDEISSLKKQFIRGNILQIINASIGYTQHFLIISTGGNVNAVYKLEILTLKDKEKQGDP